MSYHFTRTLANQICRICGKRFDKTWSSGGLGAVCRDCSRVREEINLVNAGLIRGITRIPTDTGYSFTFEANIDGVWVSCSQPCGNWSWAGNEIIPVGWWELNRLAHCEPTTP
jgi:hypothetical protein